MSGTTTSRGHLGWQGEGAFEIYVNGGAIYRAPVDNVIDLDTGCRHGRWMCEVAHLKRAGGFKVVLGPGFVPTRRAKRRPPAISFGCMECGHKFRTTKAAERAAFGDRGCPGCGGSDIDAI